MHHQSDPEFSLWMCSVLIWVPCRVHSRFGLQDLNHTSQSQPCISCGPGFKRWPSWGASQRAAGSNNQERWLSALGDGLWQDRKQWFTGVATLPHAICADLFVATRFSLLWLVACLSNCVHRESLFTFCWHCPLIWNAHEVAPRCAGLLNVGIVTYHVTRWLPTWVWCWVAAETACFPLTLEL